MQTAILSPYHGGSHAEFARTVEAVAPGPCTAFTLPPKKWGWKLRTAALTLSQTLPSGRAFQCVLATSMLNLSELCSLRPDWAAVPRKVLYMHENQLVYPKQNHDQEERDYYFGHAQIVSCLVADVVAWNSAFNRDSFLNQLVHFLKLVPASRPNASLVADQVRAKSVVVHFPMSFSRVRRSASTCTAPSSGQPLHLAFPHRWEHDKGVDAFLALLRELIAADVDFRVSVFGGEEYMGTEARAQLGKVIGDRRIVHVGRVPSHDEYLARLASTDVAVSTAQHEFFGCAMIEAALLGCACLCPRRLAYAELFADEALYGTDRQAVKTLVRWCRDPELVRRGRQARAESLNVLVPGFAHLVNVDEEVVRDRVRSLLRPPASHTDRFRFRLRFTLLLALSVLGGGIVYARRSPC